MELRAKTKYLFDIFELDEIQKRNSELNLYEIENNSIELRSVPRRLVLELTNACNMNCVMCGRNTVDFKPTIFNLDWLTKFECILNEIEEVSLFGWGEPTVHTRFIDILKYLDNFNVRKYFCTNGMKLDLLKDAIFEYNVDIIAISIDGATAETNNSIRRGSDLEKIKDSLKEIVKEKKLRGTEKPYMNFVFCAMESNIGELPDLVKLASEIGLEEVKAVYLTAFDKKLEHEVLWNKTDKVKSIFNETVKLGDELGVKVKLPHIQGEDEAGNKYHKDCFVGWRDLFLGSDGYIRPCMSTSKTFFKIDEYENFDEIWNHEKYKDFRRCVNVSKDMPDECKRCYQSSHCNWNRRESFIQIGEEFAPEWTNDG